MIDPSQLLKEIIRPTLKDLGLWSEAAECLVLGTACVESECGRWLRQIGGGPAVGIYQMEPGMTGHDDIWVNYLAFQPELTRKVRLLMINSENPTAEEMIGNLYYATAMCRIKYRRDRELLPGYLRGQAEYWKRVYNSILGKTKGTPQKYIDAWNRYVEPGTA